MDTGLTISTWIAIGIGGALALVPQLWRVTRLLVTTLHEAGHALVSLVTGSAVAGIRVHLNSSGVTVSEVERSVRGKVSRVFTLLAGYPTPLLLGAIALATPDLASNPAWGWAAITATSLLVLVFARSFFTVMLALFLGIPALMFSPMGQHVVGWFGATLPWWATSPTVTWPLLVGLASLMLVGGTKDVLALWTLTDNRAASNDAAFLREATGVPARLWAALFVIIAVVCLCLAASALMGISIT